MKQLDKNVKDKDGIYTEDGNNKRKNKRRKKQKGSKEINY